MTQSSTNSSHPDIMSLRPGVDPDAPDELIVTRKEEPPQFYKLSKSLHIIGRDESNDIPLNAKPISRNHARCERRNGIWHIIDLGSTNGTYLNGERMATNGEQVWKSGHPVQIGPYTLQWQSALDTITDQTLILAPEEFEQALADVADEIADGDLNVALTPDTFELKEGDSAEIKIGILSESQLTKHFEIEVRGFPNDWYRLSHTQIALTPKKHTMVTISLRIPRSGSATGGDHDYDVLLKDIHNNTITTVSGKVTVPTFTEFSLSLNGGAVQNAGNVYMVVANEGNLPDHYKVKMMGIGQNLQFSADSWDTSLLPNTSDTMRSEISALKRPLIGKPISEKFSVLATAGSGLERKAAGEILITPIVSMGLVALVALALMVLITVIYIMTLI